MNEYLHTFLALAVIFISWRFGKWQSTKDALERYTENLEEHGFIHIQQMKDGSYEFIKHWKHQQQNTDESI
jgi:hypothetical protein